MSAAADWQQDKSLAECNDYMLQNRLSCDVSFRVGPDEGHIEVIEAHKYVLISRSPVFFSMFCGELAETSCPVRIPDIEVDIFKDILHYIYCDDIVKDPEKLETLIYGAEKYMLCGMVRKCISWISSCINQDSVCPALNCAILYGQSDLQGKCLDYLFNNAQEVLQGAKFSKLSHQALKIILSSDDLDVDEMMIFEACLRWAEDQCHSAGIEPTQEAMREILGDCLYLIRFPQIPGPVFVKLTKGSHILSPEEKLALQEFYITREEPEDLQFNINPRGKLPQVCRFQRVSDHGEWSCNAGKHDAICFVTSRAIQLKGVCLFGGKSATSHEVHLELLDDNLVTVTSQCGVLESSGHPEPIPFRFPKSVYVSAGVKYTVKVSMKGTPVYRGVDGKDTVEYLGMTVTFTNSRLSKNGTEKTCGQIPGILFRMLQVDLGTDLNNSMDTSGSNTSLPSGNQ